MARDKNEMNTPKQILEAAIVIFSEKGYHKTTIAEICQQAGTNIASVNYHFGDKKTLYVEAWRHAFHHSIKKHPPNSGLAPGASVEERLRQWITALLRRLMDPTCYDFDLVHMELSMPTGLLTDAIKECVGPTDNDLVCILRKIIGEKASDEEIQLCAMSIHAQCLNPLIIRKRHEKMDPSKSLPPPVSLKADVDMIIEHVYRFSMGGIQAMVRHLETDESRK